MDPKTIIASIDQNLSVINAQVQRLSSFSAKPATFRPSDQGAPDNIASLLEQTVMGHLQGASDCLRVIAQVEAEVRGGAADPGKGERASRMEEAEIIDVEVIKAPTAKQQT